MIFHKNCLLADNSHGISYIFSKIRKDFGIYLSSDAVVIGVLRVEELNALIMGSAQE